MLQRETAPVVLCADSDSRGEYLSGPVTVIAYLELETLCRKGFRHVRIQLLTFKQDYND